MAGIGLEKRTSILPTPATPSGPGLLGPDYSFADNVPLPGQVGVRDGDDLGSVIDSVKAIGYYVDMIGFGESSSGLSRGVGPGGGPKALGVRTWMKTGLKCSNGADMWMYLDGVPKGNALGQRISDGLRSAGLPGMRGLAPGIMEDAQSALNPIPIVKTIFGTGFPQCRLDTQPVGDQDGNIQNTGTGQYYVQDHETVFQQDGRSVQKRWAFDRDLTQDVWNKTLKTHCADGFRIGNHVGNTCTGVLNNRSEGFESGSWLSVGLATLAVLGAAVAVTRLRK
jgi:hypothetical protein